MRSTAAGFGRMLWRLLRAPLFASVAVLTLGVGIGANAALFSVVYGVLLKPLPFDEPETLVGVWHRAPGMNVELMQQGPAFYFTYRDENRVFQDFGLWHDDFHFNEIRAEVMASLPTPEDNWPEDTRTPEEYEAAQRKAKLEAMT